MILGGVEKEGKERREVVERGGKASDTKDIMSFWEVVEVLGAETAQRKDPPVTMTTILCSKTKDVDLKSSAVQRQCLQ